jgi:outer membrane biosynthesis protein TonB
VVKARFTIDEGGVPTDFHIISSVTPAVDRLVEKNILDTWRYQPATLKGQAVRVYYRVMIAINQPRPPAAPASQPAAPPQN